jgi:hypothetical protein
MIFVLLTCYDGSLPLIPSNRIFFCPHLYVNYRSLFIYLMYRLLNTVGKTPISVFTLTRSPVFNPLVSVNSNVKSIQKTMTRSYSNKTLGNPTKKTFDSRSYSSQSDQEAWKSSPIGFARHWMTREVRYSMDI